MRCCCCVVLSTWLSAALCAAQTCKPLCYFDAQYTQRCLVSRWYSAALLERLHGESVWGEIAAQSYACESLSSSQCDNATACSVFGNTCSTARGWMARKLASPIWQGGASLGAQKCGLLGQLMAEEAKCMDLEEDACATYNGSAECTWDIVRNACGMPPSAVLALLRQDYGDELARLALRRERCMSFSESLCKGSCWWDAVTGRCNLRPDEALMALIDEDCPLRTVLSSNSVCDELITEATCLATKRTDGFEECIWSGTCVANPGAVELDLLRQLGLLTSQVQDLMTASIQTCSELSDCANATPVFCVDDLPLPPGWASRKSLTAVTVLLLLAGPGLF